MTCILLDMDGKSSMPQASCCTVPSFPVRPDAHAPCFLCARRCLNARSTFAVISQFCTQYLRIISLPDSSNHRFHAVTVCSCSFTSPPFPGGMLVCFHIDASSWSSTDEGDCCFDLRFTECPTIQCNHLFLYITHLLIGYTIWT